MSLNEQREEARKLLTQLVGFNCIVEHDESGAPYLPDHPELHISISHCPQAVAAVVCDSMPVGIDIEARRSVSAPLFRRVCSPAELAEIEASPDPQMHFLQLWTRKEAILKCRGTGIMGFGSMVTALDDPEYRVHDIDTGFPDIVAAVAWKNKFGRLPENVYFCTRKIR